ncbi:hypothetical protein V757_04380 [Pelistega indica]|uniref:TRAP transporter small permease protein n=2 Tax=Pelistega indica TaxID=1414851 RepID=V8G7H3_9BURK|nr:hypothetical protein V757_04380 [Pelistega indica]
MYRYLSQTVRIFVARIVFLLIALLTLIFAYGCYLQMTINWSNIAPISGLPLAIFYLAGLISSIAMMCIVIFKGLFSPSSLYETNFEEVMPS